MLYFWIAAFVILVLIEVFTVQLVTIWFALGALGALVTSLLTDHILIQWVVFITVSVVSLLFTRPLFKKLLKKKIEPTNADKYIGSKAIVIEDINNLEGCGRVKVKGLEWTARSKSGEIIKADSTVVVEAIEGVKLMVEIEK